MFGMTYVRLFSFRRCFSPVVCMCVLILYWSISKTKNAKGYVNYCHMGETDANKIQVKTSTFHTRTTPQHAPSTHAHILLQQKLETVRGPEVVSRVSSSFVCLFCC